MVKLVMFLAKKLSICVSAALLTACFVSPVIAGPTNVTFTATANTTEYLVPTPNGPCPLAGMTTGSGTATYIGKISLTATDCVTPQPDGSFIFSNGKLVFTASNGDTVTATYGPGSFIALTPGPVYTIKELFVGAIIITLLGLFLQIKLNMNVLSYITVNKTINQMVPALLLLIAMLITFLTQGIYS